MSDGNDEFLKVPADKQERGQEPIQLRQRYRSLRPRKYTQGVNAQGQIQEQDKTKGCPGFQPRCP